MKPFARFLKYILYLLLPLLLPLTALAQQQAGYQPIKFRSVTLSLKEVLETIEQQTALNFSYNPQQISENTSINLPSDQQTLEELLALLQQRYGIRAIRQGKLMILQIEKKKSQTAATINGTIRDASSGEALPGAQLILRKSNTGAISNAYGFFSLTRPLAEEEKIEVRFIGYKTADFDYHFKKDSTADVFLTPDVAVLKDVVITAQAADEALDTQTSAGNFIISAKKIKETASFAGEPDALKTLQLFPGIQSGNEGTTNLSVRGGTFDQNLFLLDEAPVYNPSHALSFFSVFNPDALQSVTLYKSAMPVMYGGRLSSVVDIRMKEGNRLKRSYSGTIGTIASRLTVEGPFSKKDDKASFMISGRWGYAGHVVNGIYLLGAYAFNDPTANISTDDNKISFFDFNAKINYRKSQKDHFYLSAYAGHDDFYFNHITSGYSLAWGNQTATFRWNHVHNPKLFSNTTALFSNYNYQYKILNNTRHFLWTAGFKELDLKQDYDYYANHQHHLVFGWGIGSHWIKPGKVEPRSEQAVTRTYALENQQPISTYLYLGNQQQLHDELSIHYGLRYNSFFIVGPGTRYHFQQGEDFPSDSTRYQSGELEKVYHRLDPRVSLKYSSGKQSITASYDRNTQYLHLLANSSIGLPTDVWMPSGGSIEPQTADIYALTFQRSLHPKITGSIGGYYKKLHNILDFKDNANLFVNRYVESQLLQGSGQAYGAEFFLQKTGEKFSASASYTWSKAMHKIEGVNEGQPFPSRYDKRHNFSTTGRWILSKRWETSFNFTYTTGGAITVPAGNFSFDGVAFSYYTSRNGYRLPDYHRLDVSFRYYPRKNDQRSYKSFWSLDVFNVYGRKNPFTVYAQQQDYNFFSRTDMKALYLFKVVPTLSYNFTF